MGQYLGNWLLVEAPVNPPQPFGIFSVVEPRLTIDEHWRSGIQWQSQACGDAKVTTGPCIDEISPLTPDDYCSISQFDPFTVYIYDNDPLPGHTIEQHKAQASQRLINAEQRAVEEKLWSEFTSSVALENLFAYDPRFALGWVEQKLSQQYNGTGIIHISHLFATLVWDSLVVSGGKTTTAHGTPVAIGAGYDSINNPVTDYLTIIGTGNMIMYRGEIDTREQAIATGTNNVSYVAQRDYAIGWDCTIVGAGVQVTPIPSNNN